MTGAGTGPPEPAPDAAAILDTTDAGGAAIRGSAVRVAGYGVGIALSILSAGLLLRYLGAREYGRYATVLSIVTIVGGVTEAGMGNIGLREFAVRDGESRAALLSNLLGLRTVLTLVGVAGGVLFGIVAGYDSTLAAGTAIGGVGVLAGVLQMTYGIPLMAGLRLGWVTAIDMARQVVTVVAIVALVVAGSSLLPFFLVPIPAALAALAVTLPLIRGTMPLLPAFDRQRWLELLRLALPYAAATAAGVLYAYVSIVLMSLISTEAETGYFGASFRIVAVLAAVPALMIQSTFPILARAARDDETRLAYASQRLFDIAVTAGTWMSLVLAAGAPVAIAVVAGNDFDPSIGVLQIQSGALLATFLAGTWGFGLLSIGSYRALLVCNSLALAVSIGLTLALVPSMGADGAAVATLVGETVLALSSGLALMRSRPQLRVELPYLGKAALAAAAALAVLVIPGLPALADMVLVSIVYFGVLAAVRGFPPELAEALSARLRRS